LRSAATGKTAPIDANPEPGGNIQVDLRLGTYRVLTRAQREAVEAGMGDDAVLRFNHFATCRNVTARRLARARRAAVPVGGRA
jgi:hypothetical protein